MNNIIDLLTQQLHEHQQSKPETPTDRYPWWCHNQFEQWQREDQALRFCLGILLVERELANKEQDS